MNNNLTIILSCMAIYYALGLILVTGITKSENADVYVRDIPQILGIALFWPVVLIMWGIWTIGEKWGDKKIL